MNNTDFEPLLVDLRAKANGKLSVPEFENYCALIRGAPQGWFTISDREPLTQYVKLLSRISKCQAGVDALKSEICETSHGPQTHPAVRLLDLLNRRASAMREELRINPSSRGKAMRTTRLGRARAEKEQGADDVAAPAEVVPSREGLMFGGARAASMLGVKGPADVIRDN